MHPQLIFVQSSRLAACMARASVLGRTWVCEALLTRHTWHHRVRTVVILLVCDQLVLIELLLNISHVTVRLNCLPFHDLPVELVLVEVLSLVLGIVPASVELAVENADVHGLSRIGHLLSREHLGLVHLVSVELVEQLVLVVVFQLLVVLLCHLSSLIKHLNTVVLLGLLLPLVL